MVSRMQSGCLTLVVGMCWCMLAPTCALVQLTWKHDKAFNDVLPVAVNVTSSVPVTSRMECAWICLQDRWCNTLFYNDVKGHCLRQRMTYEVPYPVTSALGWQYYKLVSGGPDHFSDRVSGFHYRLDRRLVEAWRESRQHCVGQGEDLVVLEPVLKADFISDFFRTNSGGLDLPKDIFIGASRPDPKVPFPETGQDYRWVNGQALNATATSRFWWKEGHPVFDVDKGAVELARLYNYSWKEAGHDKGKRFSLCEKPFLMG